MIKTCKIKLYLKEDNVDIKKEKYQLLNKMAWESRDIRNETIRNCLMFKEMKFKDIPIPVERKNGKEHTYSTIGTMYRRDAKFLTETQASWAQTAAENKFKNESKDYYMGKKNIPVFKDMNLIVKSQGSKLYKTEEEYIFEPSILTGQGFIFGLVNIDKDKSLRIIINRVIDGTYTMSDSFIKKVDKFWYLFLVFKFEVEKKVLDKNIICGVDLGWKIPAYCGLNDGYERKAIGDSQAIQRYKTQVKNRRKNLQKNISTIKGGHGYSRKTKLLDSLKTKESNFVKNQNHNMSKQIIEFCIKNNADTIHFEKLTNEVKKNSFLTAYWSYFQLQQMVEYKAKEQGIKVKYINPAYTSQTCSKCGHISKENRKSQSEFVCTECGNKLNADYNASINIARNKDFSKSAIEENTEEAIA
jgi:IS605 OrfB family transposase